MLFACGAALRAAARPLRGRGRPLAWLGHPPDALPRPPDALRRPGGALARLRLRSGHFLHWQSRRFHGMPARSGALLRRLKYHNPPPNMSAPYIPAKDADFALWLQNFSTLITATPTAYGLIAGDAVIIAAVNSPFQAAFIISTNPATRTAPTVATTRGARASAEAIVRPYAMRINANQSVSNAQRLGLGITVRITVPTPIPAPATSPALVLVAAVPGQMELQYRDSSTPTSKQKPFGASALALFSKVAATPTADPADATFTALVTKTPFLVPFSAPDAGQTCTFFARWITASGPSGIAQNGPWSAPLSVVVV